MKVTKKKRKKKAHIDASRSVTTRKTKVLKTSVCFVQSANIFTNKLSGGEGYLLFQFDSRATQSACCERRSNHVTSKIFQLNGLTKFSWLQCSSCACLWCVGRELCYKLQQTAYITNHKAVELLACLRIHARVKKVARTTVFLRFPPSVLLTDS